MPSIGGSIRAVRDIARDALPELAFASTHHAVALL